MFSNPRGMAICIGVTGVASILLWFYFKNRIESVESKLDNMFNMIQNFSEQTPTIARDNIPYYNEPEVVEDPFESKELQYENKGVSQQLPTEMFEKEVENIVNNNTKLIAVSDNSSDESDDESEDESDDESEDEGGLDLGKVVDHILEVEIKKDTGETVHLEDKKIYQAEDSLDEVDTDDSNSDNEKENIENLELKEEVKEYSNMKVSELKKLAQGKGLTGYTKLNKAGLVNLLENN